MGALSLAVPKPAHVADAAVYDFDMYLDPALLSDPHERVQALLREAPPVFWTPRNGGHWVIIGHAENYAAMRDTATFTSEILRRDQMVAMLPEILPMVAPGTIHIPTPIPIGMDPPEHTRFRAPLQAAFSPKAILARKEEIRTLANELIDAVIGDGHCDFISAIAEPLPVQVFLKMMGLPLERSAEFRVLVHEFLAPQTDPFDPIIRMCKVADAMKHEIAARRDDPRDDLLSLLWKAEIDGQPMTFEVMSDFSVLLFIAGLDTVINGMGFGVRHLATNPGLQEELRAAPQMIVEHTEELLRRYTFTIPMRRVARDAEFGGWQLKADEQLMLFLPGADLDPREFERPEVFDPKRENNVHIAFGVGPHRCLGSHLARIELQVIYEQMISRLPNFRLEEDKPVRFRAGNIIAIESLPLRWD